MEATVRSEAEDGAGLLGDEREIGLVGRRLAELIGESSDGYVAECGRDDRRDLRLVGGQGRPDLDRDQVAEA